MLPAAATPLTAAEILTGYGRAVALAVNGAGSTAYTYETENQSAQTTPIVDLSGARPYVYTDCSGWVSYLLTSLAPVHAAMAAAERNLDRFNPGAVKAYDAAHPGTPTTVTIEESKQAWARADVLQHLFATNLTGAKGFSAVQNFADVQGGDLIAYASGIYSDPRNPNAATTPALQTTSDTGHTMLVLGKTLVDASQWTDLRAKVPGIAAVYAVEVVDSSGLRHFDDNRHFGDNPIFNSGGLGTGTIWFAVNASGTAVATKFDTKDPWYPGNDGDPAKVISATRLTSTIELSGDRLVDGFLTVNAFANATTRVQGVDYGTVSEVLSGEGGLLLTGGGLLRLGGGNSYAGGTLIQSGTLHLTANDAAGTGTITFAAGTDATLRLDAGVAPGNVIAGFTYGDTIDLSGTAVTGIAYHAHVRQLEVATTTGQVVLQMDRGGSLTDGDLLALSDGMGGTNIRYAYGEALSAPKVGMALDAGGTTQALITNAGTLQVGGTAIGGSKVAVLVDGAAAGQVMADVETGAWHYTTRLGSGAHSVTVTSSDLLGTTYHAATPLQVLAFSAPDHGVSEAAVSSVVYHASLEAGYQTQFLAGTGSLLLTNGALNLGTDTQAAWVIRLYEGLLGRDGDAQGLSFWMTALEQGDSLATVAGRFLSSAEYAARHAAGSEAALVGDLYEGLLGRAAATAETSYWIEALATRGGAAGIAAAIASSPEAQAHWAEATTGVWIADPVRALVHRSFELALDRDVDATGMGTWSQALKGGMTAQGLAQEIINSGEFQARHAGEDSAGVIAAFYQDGLGRAGSAEEVRGWVEVMHAGAGLADVLASFAASPEALAHLDYAL